MSAETVSTSTSKTMLWTGYIMTALPVLGLLFSGIVKLVKPEGIVTEFTRLGWPDHLALPLGIVELASAILYVIPRTSVLGAILLTGYLGGATATHLRIGDPFIPPIIMGMLIWGALWFRDARIRTLIPLRS